MIAAGWRMVAASPATGLAAAVLALLATLLARRAGASWRDTFLRGWIALSLAAAIADVRWVPPDDGRRIVVLDRSGSLAPGALATAMPTGAGGPADDAVAFRLAFGDRTASPLGAALDLAARGLRAGGRVVVVSDGAATDGDAAIAAARRAAARGVRVDAVVLAARRGVDAAVIALQAPPTWRSGDIGRVSVSVAATVAVSATVRLEMDGQAIGQADVNAGPQPVTTEFTLAVPAGSAPVGLEATVSAPGDREPSNDRLAWVVQLAPAPRVLVIGDSPEAVSLADALEAEGLTSAVLGPSRVSGRLSALESWDALAWVDLPATALGVDQLATLEALVTDRGVGLLLTGGRQSFLQGAWRGTALARLSPLALTAPPHGDREAVALLLLIDRSASMAGGDSTTRLTKLDLAREAAVLAAEVLQPGDTLGVVAYDTSAEWILPLTHVGDGANRLDVEGALRGLEAGGGTLIQSALDAGLPLLGAVDAPTRHAVLLSDGRDAGESDAPLAAAVEAARAQGVTFSTLGVGRDADPDLLGRLAQLGRGRAYVAVDAGDLPRLTVEESEIVRARAERTGTFRAQLTQGAPQPMVAGVDVGALPELNGFLALRPRTAATVALRAPTGDPLLAGWQVGLGRVAAWTSDVGAEWARAWPQDAAARKAWTRAVRWAARAQSPSSIDVTTHTDDATGRTTVTVDAAEGGGASLDLATATLVITDTEGASRTDLPQVAPGRYRGTVTLARAGAWPAVVTVVPGGGRPLARLTRALSVARGYAPELRPRSDGAERLAAVAAAGGGAVIDAADGLGPPAGERRTRRLWPWLAALAAVAWPVDVARQMRGPIRAAPPADA